MKSIFLMLLTISSTALATADDAPVIPIVCGKLIKITAYTAGGLDSGVYLELRNEKNSEKESMNLILDQETLFKQNDAMAAYNLAIASYTSGKRICIARFKASDSRLKVHTISLNDEK